MAFTQIVTEEDISISTYDVSHILLENGELYHTREYGICFYGDGFNFLEMNGLFSPIDAFEEFDLEEFDSNPYLGYPNGGAGYRQISGGWDTLSNLTQTLSYKGIPYLEIEDHRVQEIMESLQERDSFQGENYISRFRAQHEL